MKIKGINLHSTFPGEIQLFKDCDLIGVMTCQLHEERGLKLESEGSVSRFKFRVFSSESPARWALLGFVGLGWTIKVLVVLAYGSDAGPEAGAPGDLPNRRSALQIK